MRNNAKKLRKNRDSGQGYIDALAAIALASAVTIGGLFIYNSVNASMQQANALQTKKSSISETLNRASQSVQVANPIILATPTELIVERKDAAGAITRTRWVKDGTTLYQQTWTGATNGYPFGSAAWIAPTTAKAAAPNGDGTQSSDSAVTNVTSPSLFNYIDKDAAAIAVGAGLTSQNSATDAIRRVEVEVTANAIKGTSGPVHNKTSAAVRNGDGGHSDGTLAAPTCPAVSFDPASLDVPKLNWTTVAGITTYEIRRNNIVAATVNVAAPSTTGTWTETSTGTPGEATTYEVLAKDASGQLSESCRQATWRLQIGAPTLQDSTVLPRGEEASAWSTAPDNTLSSPQIKLNWNAVQGATGYQLLYRALDLAGNPKSDEFLQATPTILPASQTSFTWSSASWGTRYEWFVKASSKSGQSADSRHIQILTHPKTPGTVKVSPAYGTGPDKTVNGLNNLSWDPSVSAARYEVWRYDTGTAGAASLAGTTTGTTFTDTVPYGSTYTYYVAAKNYGPRGTDGAGADVSAFRASPNPESSVTDTSNNAVGVSYRKSDASGSTQVNSGTYYGPSTFTVRPVSVVTETSNSSSAKPQKVSQLQYPPIPAISAPSTAGTASRDFDGSNRVVWNAAKSATGYHVQKWSWGGKVATCLTTACQSPASGTTATSYTDPAPKGSKQVYAVLAYNPTGLSIDFSEKVALTQRPAAPVVSVTQTPSLTSNVSGFSTSSNADDGNPNPEDRFCTVDNCAYQLLQNGNAVATSKHSGDGAHVFENFNNPEGASVTWTLRSKNDSLTNGGWSDTTAQVANTYPGKFGVAQWIGDQWGNQRQRFMVDLVNTDVAGSTVTQNQAGFTTVLWGNSAGAASVRMRRVAVANEATTTDGNKGLPGPGTPDGTWGAGAGQWQGWAAPGATYRHELTATAPNGLQRTVVTQNLITPADLPRHGTTQVMCSMNLVTDANQARWDWPEHRLSAKLVDFQHWPLYGDWKTVGVRGLTWFKGQGPSWVNSATLWPGSPQTDVLAGAGYGYYYGITNGFDVYTEGNGGGDSATIRQSITSIGTYESGCGAQGGTWWDLREPNDACYGYKDGDAYCQTNNPWNRPQWRSR